MRRGAGGGIGEVSKGRRRQRERRGRDRRQSREAPTVPAAQNHQTSTLSTIIISVITTIIISISIVIRKGLPSVERRRHLEAVHRKTRQISLFSTSTVTSHGLIYWLYAYFAFSRGIFLVTDGHFEARRSGNLALPMREALCEFAKPLHVLLPAAASPPAATTSPTCYIPPPPHFSLPLLLVVVGLLKSFSTCASPTQTPAPAVSSFCCPLLPTLPLLLTNAHPSLDFH